MSSSNALGGGASSISTLNRMGLLEIQRGKKETADAIFGELFWEGNFVCFTMERKSVIIPAGTYNARLEISPHFGFQTPRIDVPQRTYIEIHPANLPSQLEGCVAVGSTIDGDALDNSRQAFDKMMSVLPQNFTVKIS